MGFTTVVALGLIVLVFTLPVTGRDPVQYVIAGWLLGLGAVLWALTWVANRALRGRRTSLRDPGDLTGGGPAS